MNDKYVGKPKAAILTWCDNNGPTNYGQILQCYAMQRLVKKAGREPLVVQYRKKDERDLLPHNFSNGTALGRLLNARYERHYKLKVVEGADTLRMKRFREFIRTHIPLSPPCYTKAMVEEITADCETLICGSDQIWNPVCFDPIWFLDFGTPKQKRIAYAPSGIFHEKPEFETCYRKMAALIEKLDEASVREQIGADILGKYTKKEIQVKEDPSLRLDRAEWDRVADDRLIDGDYVFCYLLGGISPHQMILRELKRKHQAKRIAYIPTSLLSEGNLKGFLKCEDAGPAQFLSLVKYAKAVCTDSFHGTALALQYGIPIYNVRRADQVQNPYGGKERIDNLLQERGLEKRWVKNLRELNER